ncbi:IS5 family transposase [Solwaraspora sp. WMMD791]|uniref:IS5 family transposase n=1 Tax=Solwaraspora sp. WMMD791 TaxID=3016086 RepID=UPI00249A1C90|nr:IS5 family transposase [Solwaraspora sp. WMMD791]WFE26131.1 IS5 family transposase [Solwaraspora sp. WMMD791]
MGRRRAYPSDLTDEQWAVIELILPLIKEPGRVPKHPRRDIVDAILYVIVGGVSWRQLPADFPPWQTVYWQFRQWERRGVTERIVWVLREELRVDAGRDPQPSAGIIDSQSVKGADTVGSDSRGYDAGKKINGRRRFIVTDTMGLLVTVWVLAASWQDRDGGRGALVAAMAATPSLRLVFADQGFAGRFVDWCDSVLGLAVEIVRPPAGQRGFQVHRRRWVVERTLAWLTACRRLARDYERHPAVSEAMIRWAAINQMVRRLTRGGPSRRQRRRTFDWPD